MILPLSGSACGVASINMTQEPRSDPVYLWQEDVENLERYCVGGYHPVRIGDVLSKGHYHIIHKLGYGSYSTVWLARDMKLDRYVAIKIVVADASKDSSESRILHHLRQHHEGFSSKIGFVSSLLDEFSVSGHNGKHVRLSTEPAGCSIAESKEASIRWMFPLPIARAVAAQAILGLQSIHRSGIIHGGKSKPHFLS